MTRVDRFLSSLKIACLRLGPGHRRSRRPLVVVDGYFFQIAQSGIARVWSNLLREWSRNGFSTQIIVLDRAGTAPKLPALSYLRIHAFKYSNADAETHYLEKLCRRLNADLFVSTYYTRPLTTPSVFVGHDMIPEVMGFDLTEPMWVEKRRAIEHASAHVMVSKNSARDLERLAPCVAPGSTIVAYCGIDPSLKFRPSEEIADFRRRHKLEKPYILVVGDRMGGITGYKNGVLVFEAFAQLPNPEKYILLCVGGNHQMEPHLRKLVDERHVSRLTLSDEDLACAYSGAHALVYPSLYEGFGLPLIEAMTCGCPVITCRNSSLAEIAGDAALFVDETKPAQVVEKIVALEQGELRQALIRRGILRANQFSFAEMAETIQDTLLAVYRNALRNTDTVM